MIRTLFVASGRVQGVGFRAYVCKIANSLQLVGYAKNLPDGTVEILVEGDEKKTQELAERIRKTKLPLIYVENLQQIRQEKITKLIYSSFFSK
ncbi:MAG: acylphosphatase [Candidatus Anstonellaceae archaeon]